MFGTELSTTSATELIPKQQLHAKTAQAHITAMSDTSIPALLNTS
jgi:hypothetical protein